jgi:hypothetical protein
MTTEERRLVKHLALAVVVKLMVLGALWFAFVRDATVNPGSERTAAHIGVAVPPQGDSR